MYFKPLTYSHTHLLQSSAGDGFCKCVRSREHLTPAASYGEFFRLIFSTIGLIALSGCTTTQPTIEENNDPLNLYNDEPAITVEGGTESDPLDLFTDEEEKAMEQNQNE